MKKVKNGRRGVLKKGFFLFPLIMTVVCVAGACCLYFFTPVSSFIGLVSQNGIPTFEKPKSFSETKIIDDVNKTIKMSEFTYPKSGEAYGILKIDSAGVKADLYWGDGPEQFSKGLGTYMGSLLPGFGSTTLIAGHTNTYFRNLGNVKEGDIVSLQTTWGTYEYKISGTRIAENKDKTAYDLSANRDNLIMYTCYPFGEIGLTTKRFFVYAEYVSGPKIVYD